MEKRFSVIYGRKRTIAAFVFCISWGLYHCFGSVRATADSCDFTRLYLNAMPLINAHTYKYCTLLISQILQKPPSHFSSVISLSSNHLFQILNSDKPKLNLHDWKKKSIPKSTTNKPALKIHNNFGSADYFRQSFVWTHCSSVFCYKRTAHTGINCFLLHWVPPVTRCGN